MSDEIIATEEDGLKLEAAVYEYHKTGEPVEIELSFGKFIVSFTENGK